MKTLRSIALVAALASAALLTGCKHTDSGEQGTAHMHKYTCPMHPEVVSSTPGKCPKCGMDLVHKD